MGVGEKIHAYWPGYCTSNDIFGCKARCGNRLFGFSSAVHGVKMPCSHDPAIAKATVVLHDDTPVPNSVPCLRVNGSPSSGILRFSRETSVHEIDAIRATRLGWNSLTNTTRGRTRVKS